MTESPARTARSRRAQVAALVLVATLAAATSACSVTAGDGADDARAQAASTTSTPGTTAPDGPDGAETTTTAAPDDDPGTSTDVPEGSELFTDEDGLYTMSIDPTWESSDAPGPGISLWYVAPVHDGFQSNLNILTQETGSLTLDAYLDGSIPGIESMLSDTEMLTNEVRTGAHGQDIGVLEYRGSAQGKDIHFYAVVTEVETGMALATLTMNEDEHEALQADIVPYLETLQAT